MDRRAFIVKLKPEYRQQYIEAHECVSPDLIDRYRRAGFRNLSVFVLGDQVVLYVEAEDYAEAERHMDNDPVDLEWQRKMAEMKEEKDFQEMFEVFHME